MSYRTIAIPVAEVIEGGTKSEFYQDLRETLRLSAKAVNLCLSACYSNDKTLFDGKYKSINVYQEINQLFPGVTIVCANISREAQKRYKSYRWKLSKGYVSLPVVRSWPWPLLHNKGNQKTLKVIVKDEEILVRLRLKSKWWVIKLRRGSQYRDQIAGLKAALDSNKLGDSKIWVDHRKHFAIIGFACDIPPKEHKQAKGTLRVSSHREHLLTASKERDSVPFVINGDQIRQWYAERSKRYQRLRQDRKKCSKKKYNVLLESVGNKYNQRVQTYVHTVARQIVDYAVRRNVSRLTLDLTVKSYVKQFPWFQLKTAIKYKAEAEGIEFIEDTLQNDNADFDKPHVYFRYSPLTHRIKIGHTTDHYKREARSNTDCPDEKTVVISIRNMPVNKLLKEETHWHSYFDSQRVPGKEWFHAENVIAWLREVGWFGNAGNLSEIAQVLDLSTDKPLCGLSPSPPRDVK